ncbi:MAG: ADP-ribosylglycohydrolase family protein [Opitutaceae bacterium]|nr:ADP-ribosylglycohydrolase family protein [Opitutaceae bacterium]MBP9913894.1 ADP-ribosylglycohydrolase family protein [Opitutaceae bacterium]
MSLPIDYSTRVYAGVLGKIIGVYLGRPFEQWSHARIVSELGEITGYVHARLNKPLIVTDDDISGTFTFLRALADHGYDAKRLTAADIGQTWLNYLLPHRTILWWGGIGVSSEHTAWYRLKSGIPAPRSGSIAVNGATVAEQIGAQIFIDGWGLLCPGDPAQAVSLARRAGSVSHDGTAIHGAQMVAAMVALAFDRPSIDTLIDGALAYIPRRCALARMIADVRRWHAADGDWRQTLKRIQQTYGYGIYPGGCHMIPNHALIILALLYSAGDFHRAMMIVNTAGYDTDCNSGNVGCILAVRGGLAALAGGPDWRGPVADRLYLPTADGGRTISDAVLETDAIVLAAHRMRALPYAPPKAGARFHFSQPGSVQGFLSDDSGTPVKVANHDGRLELSTRKATTAKRPARATTATFAPLDTFKESAAGYSFVACATLLPGHSVSARLQASAKNAQALDVYLVLTSRDAAGAPLFVRSKPKMLKPGQRAALSWKIPASTLQPILSIGVEFNSSAAAQLTLDTLDWSGVPVARLLPLSPGDIAPRAWVEACTGIRRYSDRLLVYQEDGLGFYAQGAREWRNYTATASLRPRLAAAWGLAVRWQGLQRHLTVRFDTRRARIVACIDGRERVLASVNYAWPIEQTREVAISVQGNACTVSVDSKPLLKTAAIPAWLDEGAVALAISVGSVECITLGIAPLTS